jgi:TP901 family phage tail tape measure protein
MADVNANIDINIDSSNALSQLKALQRQISQFHTSIAKSSEAAALAQKGLQKNLLNSINSIGAFSAEMRTVKTSAESFTHALETNKFSMREYFRYAGASTKTFGRLFKSEFDTIGKVAEERVKRLQTQYIKMGRDTNGAMKAMAIMPTQLDMSDYNTKVQLAAQKQALFNQLMKQGSTNLLNFGKNTQWAGRQLMVGFTLPLMAVGTAATKTFMDMEAQALRFRKVYGDLFTPQSETKEALANITELGKQFTKYGVSVSQTVGLAAEAAAAGFQGLDLQRQTAQATRLSILGQVESQKALETTISLQNAFGMSSDKLAESIDFLNAVENQTVVSLDDITTAIPKVAPVIQQLGGDVKDLTFFMAAMKEGGINASEGANALKSGLAALINPTKKASDMLAGFGINATAIVEKNKGNLKATVVEFASALNALDPLARARAIEQMFGKFQFARLSTLFANVAKDGNQAARVLALANSSVEELSALSEQELGMTADSAMNKFKKSVEDLKFALVPVGEAFLEALTPIVEFVGGILEKFANLSDGTKKLITLLTVGVGAVGPVLLMTFGLFANGIANIIKLFLTLRGGYQRLTGQSQMLGEQTQYMTMEQLDAAAAAHSFKSNTRKLNTNIYC